MTLFADILLPIPLERLFTYRLAAGMEEDLIPGVRVAVPFGKSKLYTGLVMRIHQQEPTAYEAKEIHTQLDAFPLVLPEQIRLWEWIASYYMCTLGEVFRTAVPSALLLESETQVQLGTAVEQTAVEWNAMESDILMALSHQQVLSVSEIGEIIERKRVLPVLNRLLSYRAIALKEKLIENYRPKMVRQLDLAPAYKTEAALEDTLQQLRRAPKQLEVILQLFQIQAIKPGPVLSKELEKQADTSRTVIKALLDKGILIETKVQQYRLHYDPDAVGERKFELTPYQQEALLAIKQHHRQEKVTLLHGVTSSGKTEVYFKLMESFLKNGQQVLYLVPEIALTTQLTQRMEAAFGEKVLVYHSKFSAAERVEAWQRLMEKDSGLQIILGARSALFLPFQDLGLVIIDEEHESTFKQFDPAPRYHARDAAIVLSQHYGARVLLGSATPSIETYYNCRKEKYGYVPLNERYGRVLLPEMELVDLAAQYRKKRMKGHFSERLIQAMEHVLEQQKQIILFQNRRGFAPILECLSCGHVPECPNCDVSLTYHQYKNQMRCHYCGHHRQKELECQACGNSTLDTKGFGTEQVETELAELFPNARVARMDLDTTRGKYAYENLIGDFESGEVDILVGTQMLSKGLDFRNVLLVGVMNADNLLYYPHFRAHERAFQLLTQVAGRAGRTEDRGLVLIQTFNPYHQILGQVTQSNYEQMYLEQIYEREQFLYPPIQRIIKITFRHKEYQRLNEGAAWFAQGLRQVFDRGVLGPEFPPVARIRNQYQKNILLKIPRNIPVSTTKNSIKRIEKSFNAISQYRSIRLIYNVDYI